VSEMTWIGSYLDENALRDFFQHRDANSSERPVACPNCLSLRDEFPCDCGFEVSPEALLNYRAASYSLARYDWEYSLRQAMDDAHDLVNQRKGPPRVYNLAPPGDALVWMASVVVVGVISNAAYDALKQAVLRIKDEAVALAKRQKQPWTVRTIEDSELVDILIHLAQTRRDGMSPARQEAVQRLQAFAERRARST
jgi:hypothetical protein